MPRWPKPADVGDAQPKPGEGVELLTARQISNQYDVSYEAVNESMGNPHRHYVNLVELMTRSGYPGEFLPRSVIRWPLRKPYPPVQGGRVYFMQHATGGLVKIGVSVAPKYRLQSINSATHDPRYKILKTERGGNNREGLLHRQFAHLREHGEWFRPESDLLEYIEWLGYVG